MTSATFEINNVPAGVEFKLHVHGHAAYAENEPDIVCSACSMLTQALAEALMRMKPEYAPMIYTEDEEQAAATVWYLATNALDAERAESMFNVAIAGFELLAKNVPENVSVSGAKQILH